jgi:hypothetical protein
MHKAVLLREIAVIGHRKLQLAGFQPRDFYAQRLHDLSGGRSSIARARETRDLAVERSWFSSHPLIGG